MRVADDALAVREAILAQKTLSLRVQVRSFEVCLGWCSQALVVGLLPFEAALGLANDMGLFIKPQPEDWAERQMILCFRPEREHSKSLALLIEHLSTQRTCLERRVDRVVSSEQRSSC